MITDEQRLEPAIGNCRPQLARLAGGTAGVLDADGMTIPQLTRDEAEALMQDGTASAGMVAKLRAATDARRRGVGQVSIVDGRSPATLTARAGTRIA